MDIEWGGKKEKKKKDFPTNWAMLVFSQAWLEDDQPTN